MFEEKALSQAGPGARSDRADAGTAIVFVLG
jgi:hypothetical protein